MTSTPTMRDALEEIANLNVDWSKGPGEALGQAQIIAEAALSAPPADSKPVAWREALNEHISLVWQSLPSSSEFTEAREHLHAIRIIITHPPADSKPVASAFIESVLYKLDHKRQGSTHEEAAMVIRQLLFEQKKAHPPAVSRVPSGADCHPESPHAVHPPADSKPEWNYAKEVIAHENAHPPADSLEAAIGELPEGWQVNQWELHISGPDNEYINTHGPSPLAAFRAALDKLQVGK